MIFKIKKVVHLLLFSIGPLLFLGLFSCGLESEQERTLRRAGEYIQEEKYAQAETMLTEAIQTYPNSPRAYGMRGESRVKQGKIQEGIDDLTRAIQFREGYAETFAVRGLAYEKLEQDTKALEDYTKAIRLAPHKSSFYYHRGGLHLKRGALRKALDDYDSALRDPGYVDAYIGRAKTYMRMNRLDKAKEDLQSAVNLEGHNPEINRMFNQIEQRREGPEQALGSLEDTMAR